MKINFETLAASVKGLIDHLGLNSYVLYMQDFGGPVGFRIFAERPGQIAGFVIQNTNAYMEGVGDMPRQIFLPLWEKRDEASEAGARQFLAAGTTKFQYLVGARDPAAISPDNWTIDQALLDRPGVDLAQLDLLEDYKTNVAAYDSWHAAFRAHRPRTLIIWGRNDPFFIPAGAEAYLREVLKLFPSVGPMTVARAVMRAVRHKRRSVIVGPVAAIVMGTTPIMPRGLDLAFMTLLFKGKRAAA